MRHDDDFTPEERAALEGWQAKEPPPQFAEKILARDAAQRSSKRVWIGAVAIAASVVFVALAMRGGREAVHGTHHASVRTTLVLGDRATVVSEAGTELSWSIDRSGRAELEQKSGNVFYRVERGGPFVVHTPRGDVHVLGTCFRVEVEEMRAASSGLIGAGIGAALATTVMVTVYEGRVSTAAPQGAEMAIAAGESARLELGPMPAPAGQRTKKLELRPPQARREERDAVFAELPPNATPEQIAEAHRALKKEADKMREELKAMRGEVEEARLAKSSDKVYDIPQAELERMAEKCELRWDMQPLGAKPTSIDTEELEKLSLAESEREVIDRVYKEDHARLQKELAALYVEVTGDATAGSLAATAMFEEIVDKAPKGEIQRVFQKLAQERAGLLPPSPDSAKASAWERVFRLMTGAGDALQAEFAKELGPDTAKALRDLHGGWGSRSRSSSGCPEGQ